MTTESQSQLEPPRNQADSAKHQQIVTDLINRWPEHRVGPSLARISAVCDLLGDPQKSAPVIQITGTNGKGSTAIMIDALLRSAGLRTGRFSSPHLMDIRERISIDGEPISADRFDQVYADVLPYVTMVDQQKIDDIQLTFFEVITAMAFAAFADAPVDVMIMEVGMGGAWDATNVADAAVAVITPIDLDHTEHLGETITKIATEKSGIIKAGATAVLAGQVEEAANVLLQRCADVGVPALREGVDFAVLDRSQEVGGKLLRLDGPAGPVGDIFLPAQGAHQAQNAAVALAATTALLGPTAISPEVVTDGFDAVRLPGRLELIRQSPAIVIDSAHNPHGARALRQAHDEVFAFRPCVGVVAVMGDKDVEAVLEEFSQFMDYVVCTQVSGTSRVLPTDDLAELAADYFPRDRIRPVASLDQALEVAATWAETMEGPQPGVVVAGSVILAGQARTLLAAVASDDDLTDQ